MKVLNGIKTHNLSFKYYIITFDQGINFFGFSYVIN